MGENIKKQKDEENAENHSGSKLGKKNRGGKINRMQGKRETPEKLSTKIEKETINKQCARKKRNI